MYGPHYPYAIFFSEAATGADGEWLAPGQQCKGIHAGNIGEHIGRSPLSSWRPRSGELVGLMVSARARFRADTVRERSNVVMVRGPEPARERSSA